MAEEAAAPEANDVFVDCTILRRAWEERVIRQRMRSLLRVETARSGEKRPCSAMERPVRGRSSSAQGRGERNKSDEQVVPHQIRRCQCEAFVPSPQNAKKCKSCVHDVHDHQILSKAECHRIRRRIAKEVVKEHGVLAGLGFLFVWDDGPGGLGGCGHYGR